MQETRLAAASYGTLGSAAALQAPPKRAKKVVLVEVNSQDRNFSMFPEANTFQWNFPVPLKDVVRIDIVEGSLPVPMYNIDKGWNQFIFIEDGTRRTVTLTPGQYTLSALLSELQTQLTSGLNIYSVTIPDPQLGKIRITHTSSTVSSFGFLFGTGQFGDEFDLPMPDSAVNRNDRFGLVSVNNPGRILGFNSKDAFSNPSGQIDAPFPPDLDSMLRRIYLYLNFDATMDLTSIKRGLGRKEPSGIFYCDDSSPPGSIKYLSKDVWNNSIYPGPAPISRIRSLQVSLRDQYYRLLNLNGRDMTLLLEITMYE